MSAAKELDRRAGDATVTAIAPHPRWDPATFNVNPDADALYDLALDLSVKDLEGIRDQLDRMRQRVVQMLIFFGASTAFLAGALLNATQADPGQHISARRDLLFYCSVTASTVFAVLSLLFAIWVLLSPDREGWKLKIGQWEFTTPIDDIMYWADGDEGQPGVVDIKREVIDGLSKQRSFNRNKLRGVQKAYVRFVIVTFVALISWTATTWIVA